MVRSSFSYRRTSRNRRIAAIASLIIVNRARSSASVKNIITMVYLPDFYVIGSPNRINRYPYVDFLFRTLSANNKSI
jgi:hypothetical protein